MSNFVDYQSYKYFGRRLYVEHYDNYSRSRSRSYSRHRKSRKPGYRDQCYICREYGHWASQCPQGDGKGVKSGKCFKCGDKGHIAKRCTNEKRRR